MRPFWSLLLAGAGLVFVTAGALAQECQRPAQKPAPPVAAPLPPTPPSAPTVAEDKRGTDAEPPSLKIVGRPESQPQPTAEDQRRPDEHAAAEKSLTDATWKLVLATGGLVIIGFFQALLFVWQLLLLNRTVKDTRIATDAQRRMAAGMARPRIRIREIEPDFTVNHEMYLNEGDFVTGNLWIANVGGSDATVTEWQCQVIWTKRGVPSCWPHKPHAVYEGSDARPVLQAGVFGTLKIQSAEPMDNTGHDISTGRGDVRLYVIGRITYADELGNRRTTAFCRKFIKRQDEAPRFIRVEETDLEYED